jgi:hypothetical protein
LLASVDHGWVVFNHRALPTIRLVNHLVDDGRVIVRTDLTTTVSTVVRLSTEAGVVVAYEADDLDPRRRAGWSVVVTGWATTITDPEQIARYEQLLCPWVNMTMDTHDRDPTPDRHRHSHHRRHPHAVTNSANEIYRQRWASHHNLTGDSYIRQAANFSTSGLVRSGQMRGPGSRWRASSSTSGWSRTSSCLRSLQLAVNLAYSLL